MKKQRFLAFLSIAVLAMALPACSNDNSQSTSSSTSSTPVVQNEYTVTFDSKGGSSVAAIKVKEGEKVAKPDNPTKQGFYFLGWYEEDNLNKLFDFETPINKDWTLYAGWQEIGPGESKLKTAVFADIQLCYKENGSGYTGNAGSVVHAYLALKNHLAFCKAQDVDVILMNGDITNNAVEKYYELYESAFTSVYGTDESQYPEIVWNMGNHEWWDIYEHETAEAVSMFKEHARIQTDNLVRQSEVKFSLDDQETLPTYYKVINGVPFLAISGENSNGEIGSAMQSELSSWLREISELPSVQNGGPIYVAYHYALSTSLTHGNGSLPQYCGVLEELLEEYPTAIVFTGDTHYSGVNERAINQVDFTTINIGSSSYSRMDKMSASMGADEHFYNMAVRGSKASDIMVGNAQYKYEYTPTIHIMNSMDNQSTVINRYFSADDANDAVKLNGAWTIPAYSSPDNFEYTNDRIGNTEYAHSLYGANGVSWADDAQVSFGVNNGQMTVRFPDTNEYHYTEHFKIDVTGSTTKTYDVVSNYYKYSNEKENLYFILEDLPAMGSGYSVKVTAYDYFDNPSLNYLTSNVNDSSACVDPIDNALSLTYSDISTRMNLDDVVSGSNSSLEYYYNGVMRYNAGATLNRLVCDEGDIASASDYIDIGNNNNVRPIVTAKVKNLTNEALTFGITVVRASDGEWFDFTVENRKDVAGNADWTLLQWDLTEAFNLVGRSDLKQVVIKVCSSGYDAEGYVMHFLMDDVDLLAGEEVDRNRGEAFNGELGKSIDLSTPIQLSAGSMHIDFKFTSANNTYLNIILGDGWSAYFGYFQINANGTLADGGYDGVSISPLDDGYFRVTFNFAQITKVTGSLEKINLVYIRGDDWSTATGYIDINSDADAEIVRGVPFSADNDFGADIPNMQMTETFVVDIKFTSSAETYLNFILFNGSNWSDCLGYFQVNGNGTITNTPGVSISGLSSDGYYRVTINLSQVTKVIEGASLDNITSINTFYLRGGWTTASGYIDLNPTV